MQPRPDDWRNPDTDALLDALLDLENRAEAATFLRDLCTLGELRDLAQRWAVVRLLDAGLHYAEISRRTGASTATITRIAVVAEPRRGRLPDRPGQGPRSRNGLPGRAHPRGGNAAVSERRMTLAVPNKGRLVDPTLHLLHDAGLVFEERDRSLVSRVENVDLDILFVRTNDVVEFVRDAVADLGITGADLLVESGVDLPVVRRLGYGRCRLTAAVPRDAGPRRVEDLAGLRIATSHPRATRRWFGDRSIPVEVIPLSGAVEVAPRLGLAEAIVDLVSTGATLATNGLRSIGDLLASEAILVGNAAALAARSDAIDRLNTMLGAVLEGRRRKYVMMNAPAERLGELETSPARPREPLGDPARPRRDDRDPRRRRCRRCLGPAAAARERRCIGNPRPADREADRMSPTPVTMAIPTAPTAYAWEATDEQVAERYGVPLERIVRFDLNTSPSPPDLALRLLRAGDYGRADLGVPPVRLPGARGGRLRALRRRRDASCSWEPAPTRSSTCWRRRSSRPARAP